MGVFLFVRWLHSFALTVLGFAALDLHGMHDIPAGALIGGVACGRPRVNQRATSCWWSG